MRDLGDLVRIAIGPQNAFAGLTNRLSPKIRIFKSVAQRHGTGTQLLVVTHHAVDGKHDLPSLADNDHASGAVGGREVVGNDCPVAALGNNGAVFNLDASALDRTPRAGMQTIRVLGIPIFRGAGNRSHKRVLSIDDDIGSGIVAHSGHLDTHGTPHTIRSIGNCGHERIACNFDTRCAVVDTGHNSLRLQSGFGLDRHR